LKITYLKTSFKELDPEYMCTMCFPTNKYIIRTQYELKLNLDYFISKGQLSPNKQENSITYASCVSSSSKKTL